MHTHVDVNVKGVMLGTAHASRLMLANQAPTGAHIVNVASLGALAPMSGYSLYIGTKYAVRGFSLCAAKDLFPHGVYVTVVMPCAPRAAEATRRADARIAGTPSRRPCWTCSCTTRRARWVRWPPCCAANDEAGHSGKPLTVDQVVAGIMRALQTRPRELKIAATVVRGVGARMADVFPGSVLIGWSEDAMRLKGERAQRHALGGATQ